MARNKKQAMRIALVCLVLIFCNSCLSEIDLKKQQNDSRQLSIREGMYHVDTLNLMVLVNQSIGADSVNTYTSIEMGNTYEFVQNHSVLRVGELYKIRATSGVELDLYFTETPILDIRVQSEIPDEPRIPAHFALTENNGQHEKMIGGIELRGGSSISFPKKSYRIEFWQDSTGKDTKKVSLLGMRDDDDWNLQGMYNEPMRIRSKTNFKLWSRIDTLDYALHAPGAENSVQQEYVEVFMNGVYQGVYTLSERVDKKQLGLIESSGPYAEGILAKGKSWGATTFEELPQNYGQGQAWGGYKAVFPESQFEWEPIYGFVDFIMNAEEINFHENFADFFVPENAVNYFLFLNLLSIEDNTGKNIYLARYQSGEPFFYVPWDLDGSLGNSWNGAAYKHSESFFSNKMYDRLLREKCKESENEEDDDEEEIREDCNFSYALQKRWNFLRSGPLQYDSIVGELQANIDYLTRNGVYEREAKVWSEGFVTLETDPSFTYSWISQRLTYLDSIFNGPDILYGHERGAGVLSDVFAD